MTRLKKKKVIPQFPVDKLHRKVEVFQTGVCKLFFFYFLSSQSFISWRNVTTVKASNMSTTRCFKPTTCFWGQWVHEGMQGGFLRLTEGQRAI